MLVSLYQKLKNNNNNGKILNFLYLWYFTKMEKLHKFNKFHKSDNFYPYIDIRNINGITNINESTIQWVFTWGNYWKRRNE